MTSRYGPPPRHAYPHPSTRLYEQSRELEEDFPRGMPECEPVGYMNVRDILVDFVLSTHLTERSQGEQVEVRIRGNVWIVGLLVSSLHLISSYLGQGYDVEYRDLRSGKAFRGPFPTEDIRPIVR